LKPITSTQQLTLPFRAFFWFLVALIIVQIFIGIHAYSIIGQAYKGSQDINVIGSLRMLIQRTNSSAVTLTSAMSTDDTYIQLQTDVQRADMIINGLKEGNSSLGINPVTETEELELVSLIETEWANYTENIQHLILHGQEMTLTEKQELISTLSIQARKMTLAIDELIIIQQEASKSSLQSLTTTFLLTGIFSTILLIFFGYLFLHKGFIKPLANLLLALEAVMNGNSRIRLPEEGASATRKIAANYNELADNIQDTYVNISRDFVSLLTLNNRLVSLNRELLKSHSKQSHQSQLEIAATGTLANKDKDSKLIQTILHTLAEQSRYAEDLRDKQVFLEPSLENKDLIDLLITDLEMRRQRVHLYALGYGEPDSIGTCRLDRWQRNNGGKLDDHPRFESLLRHHENFHKALDDVLASIANNQTELLPEKLGSVDTFTELAIIDLQHLKEACQ